MLVPLPVGKRQFLYIGAFTLVEVMAVIAIIAILITVAIPGVGSLSGSANSEIFANMLINSLNEAKENAQQKRRYVTLCAVASKTVTQNSDIAIPACVTNTTTWNSWVIYIDSALNTGTTTQLINLTGNVPSNTITASSVGSLIFNSFGLVQINGSTNPITFYIAASGCRGMNARQVTLNANGTISVAKVGC